MWLDLNINKYDMVYKYNDQLIFVIYQIQRVLSIVYGGLVEHILNDKGCLTDGHILFTCFVGCSNVSVYKTHILYMNYADELIR